MWRKRVEWGVSPLLATMMLIAITVAASLFVYNLFFNAARTGSAQPSIQVDSVDIIKTSSATLVSVTVKNSGNVPITSCTVTVYGDTGSVTLDLGGIDVGKKKSSSAVNPNGFSVTVGEPYPVKIEATASDGSTLSKSMIETCIG